MPIKRLTTWPTEADFEADLQAALRRAVPWHPKSSIKHQTKFSFTWGRATIEVDGREQTKAHARADVLLYSDEQPSAVLELKRPGHSIDQSDIYRALFFDAKGGDLMIAGKLRTARGDRQVIIVEKSDPPAWITTRPQVVMFNKRPYSGRYGFFPMPEEQNGYRHGKVSNLATVEDQGFVKTE